GHRREIEPHATPALGSRGRGSSPIAAFRGRRDEHVRSPAARVEAHERRLEGGATPERRRRGAVDRTTALAERSTPAGQRPREEAGAAAERRQAWDTLHSLTAALIVVGGINWSLVAVGRLDLVGKLTGDDFGETNPASRAVYGLVGLGAAYQAARLAQRLAG
nr:DUF378 domain-containing protein [Actinomycetota bacterium]